MYFYHHLMRFYLISQTKYFVHKKNLRNQTETFACCGFEGLDVLSGFRKKKCNLFLKFGIMISLQKKKKIENKY